MVQVLQYERFWFSGLLVQLQARLIGRAVSFFRIASPATANRILPCGAAATGTRQHMVHR